MLEFDLTGIFQQLEWYLRIQFSYEMFSWNGFFSCYWVRCYKSWNVSSAAFRYDVVVCVFEVLKQKKTIYMFMLNSWDGKPEDIDSQKFDKSFLTWMIRWILISVLWPQPCPNVFSLKFDCTTAIWVWRLKQWTRCTCTE